MSKYDDEEDGNDLKQSEEFKSGLTDWANEPTMLCLKQDFEASKQSHDLQVGKINRWNDLLNVTGSAKPKAVKGRSSVQPKLIRRQAEWRYSALTEPFLGTDKLFKISPATFEDKEAAKQNELVLNHQWRNQINRVQFIDNYVRATVDEGTSIVRVGWKRVTTPIKTKVPLYDHVALSDEMELKAFQDAIVLKEQDIRHYNENVPAEVQAAVDFYEEEQVATKAIPTGEFTEVVTEHIVENKPTVEILNPNNVYVDPTCGGDLDKAMFVCTTFETCKADLIKEPKKYIKAQLEKVNWDSNTLLSQPDHVSENRDLNANLHDKLRKKVVAYEYWGFYDIHNTGELTPIVVTWIGDTIVRIQENPFPDGKLPFVLVPYLPVKREIYGETDAELLEDNQKILGAVARGMIDLLGRSANAQRGMAKGMLDPLNRRRYENGQDYEFNPNVNPQMGIVEGKFPDIPQSAMLMLNLQNTEAEALTGVKSFAGGISGEAYGDVAAGIRGALDAASKREMAILRRLAKGIKDIGAKLSSMNAVFLSEEEVVRITNEEFVTVKREDLKGNFDLIVDISTAEVDNAKSQDLAFMLQTNGPNGDPELTKMILAEIAELKRMPDLAHQIRTFQPTPDPLVQKQRELEIKKLELECAEIQSKIDLNTANAKKARSDADLKDLDFVETETGTKHEREMEKGRAQAQGNQNLEVTKALARPKKEGERDPDIEAAVGFNELTGDHDRNTIDNTLDRDSLAVADPEYSLGSSHFDPSLDPSLNQGLNMGG